ncbi:hypothetical protein F4810DRAFT_655345 [Camillea tinctor]|nr:hypothetical protein F4810DRAFT_655345 [Camillea tinctor]
MSKHTTAFYNPDAVLLPDETRQRERHSSNDRPYDHDPKKATKIWDEQKASIRQHFESHLDPWFRDQKLIFKVRPTDNEPMLNFYLKPCGDGGWGESPYSDKICDFLGHIMSNYVPPNSHEFDDLNSYFSWMAVVREDGDDEPTLYWAKGYKPSPIKKSQNQTAAGTSSLHGHNSLGEEARPRRSREREDPKRETRRRENRRQAERQGAIQPD